jgi:hypothetical protein
MADDPDTLRAHLYRLAELVELARLVPSEDRARMQYMIAQARQAVCEARRNKQQSLDNGRRPGPLCCGFWPRKHTGRQRCASWMTTPPGSDLSIKRVQRSAGRCRPDQVHMTRDVGTIFDELKALADRHAEMHADRARLQAELERARRSWWRRLWGVEQ